MINKEIITDIIKYFAKFPDKSGVLTNFKRGTEALPGYDDLKTYITNLPAGLMPDIKHYLFGINNEKLDDEIRNISTFFMLVEHGMINSSLPGRADTRNTDLELAITIGHPINDKNTDFFEELIIQDQCLSLIIDLIKYIDEDDDSLCGNDEFLNSNVVISPVEPYYLSGCAGYVLSFKKNDNTLI